jgi:glycosyltransferase involved in cell wall biosynthesis
LVRDTYRCITYSPFALAREQGQLREAMRSWNGENLLLFPYMGIGGAERVHATIGAAIKERAPLTVIFGNKKDHGFEQLFRANGLLIEIPRLLHHPLTRRMAHRHLAEALNRAQHPVVLASLSAVFFDLMPLLRPEVRMLYLQHAFLHQPEANAQWRTWLPWVPRIDSMLFVSRQALHEFDRFLFANNVSAKDRSRLRFMPNAVERFSPPREHDSPGLLFVGRNSEEKRLPLFIEICERLHALRPGAFRFAAAGPAARNTGCPMRFFGPINDAEQLGRVYEEHDLLVVTSSREGFPMAIMEAMAHGLAILSTPVGDVPNRVDASHSLISAGTEPREVVETFTRAAIELADSKDRLMSMREAAYGKAVAEFNPQDFAQRYAGLFREMSGIA